MQISYSPGWDYHIQTFTATNLSDLELRLREFGGREFFTDWELASIHWPNINFPADIGEDVGEFTIVAVFKAPLPRQPGQQPRPTPPPSASP